MGLELVSDGSMVWLGLSRGVSLVLTSLFLRAGLALYARVGGSGKIWFREDLVKLCVVFDAVSYTHLTLPTIYSV